jgi:hypothetical protein
VISLLKNNTPFALLILVCLAALPQFTHHEAAQPFSLLLGATAMQQIFTTITTFLGMGTQAMGKIWSIALLLTNALLINRLASTQKFMDRAGMIPAISFLLLNTLVPVSISTMMLLFTAILIVVLEKLIVSYKNPKPNNTLLIAGFFTGLATALGSPFLILFIWLTASVLIMRPASMKEWLLTSLGFLLPFYFLASGLYLTDQLKLEKIIPEFALQISWPKLSQVEWIRISLFVFLPWLSLFVGKNFFNKMMIQHRKSFSLMLILYLAMLLICIAGLNKLPQLLHLLLIPGSIMLSPLFSSFKKQFMPNLIFWGMVIVSLLR